MMTLVAELEASMDLLLEVYAPFSEPGKDWSRGGESLQTLVRRREEALTQGKPLAERFHQLWKAWEATQPDQSERARVFQARNRIVELGLAVSRSDTSIQVQLKRKSEELRRQAVESDHKSRAAQAYAGSRGK